MSKQLPRRAGLGWPRAAAGAGPGPGLLGRGRPRSPPCGRRARGGDEGSAAAVLGLDPFGLARPGPA